MSWQGNQRRIAEASAGVFVQRTWTKGETKAYTKGARPTAGRLNVKQIIEKKVERVGNYVNIEIEFDPTMPGGFGSAHIHVHASLWLDFLKELQAIEAKPLGFIPWDK